MSTPEAPTDVPVKDWPAIAEYGFMLPDPDAPDKDFWVWVRVTSPRQRSVKVDLGDWLREALENAIVASPPNRM